MALNNDILNGVFNKRSSKKAFRDELREISDMPVTDMSKPSRHTVYDKPETIAVNSGQTQDKPRTQYVHRKANLGFSGLVGVQKNIILFIYETCKALRARVTEPITIQHLAESCETTKLSAQKSVQRLELKGLLRRESFKAGRGGWTKYELDDAVYQEIILEESQGKLRTNLGQSAFRHAGDRNKDDEAVKSDLPIQEDKNSNMLAEWNEVDITPLDPIGFSRYHLNQLSKGGKLAPETVQQSIDYFAFDLNTNNKRASIKGSPINYFMGILKRTGLYTAPSNFETPEEVALKKMLEFEKNRDKKLSNMWKELKSTKFHGWINSLSEDELVKVVPRAKGKSREKLSGLVKGELYEKFEKEVWPDLEKEINIEKGKFKG